MRVYVVRKWPLQGKKSFCVLKYHICKSVVIVQRAFCAKCTKDPPTDKTICAWHKQFTETGCLCKWNIMKGPVLNYIHINHLMRFVIWLCTHSIHFFPTVTAIYIMFICITL